MASKKVHLVPPIWVELFDIFWGGDKDKFLAIVLMYKETTLTMN